MLSRVVGVELKVFVSMCGFIIAKDVSKNVSPGVVTLIIASYMR